MIVGCFNVKTLIIDQLTTTDAHGSNILCFYVKIREGCHLALCQAKQVKFGIFYRATPKSVYTQEGKLRPLAAIG